ncbi:MAG: TonB family protein [Gammaproteobacteria bacterium]|nr:TonB family protein [Gammaproteobacteria bacterium]
MTPGASPVRSLAQTGRLQRPEALRVEGAQIERLRRRRGDEPEMHYPADARSQGIDGLVLVDLLITPEGYVQEAQVVTESPADAGFGLAALDVVKTWEFDNEFKRLVLMTVSVSFLP